MDEILIQEARESLQEQGLDEDSIEMSLEAMMESGMFDYPESF